MNKRCIILYFKIVKIVLIFNLVIYSVSTECPRESPIIKNDDDNCFSIYCSESQFNSGQCKINNVIVKTQWLNNIIKFENTKGDIHLNTNMGEDKMIFSITSSNNEEKIIFALYFEETYLFKNESNKPVSYIIKNIDTTKINETTNDQCIINKDKKEYLIFINKEKSDIQILNLKKYEDFVYKQKSVFFNGPKIIKGEYSYCKYYDANTNIKSNISFFGVITSKEGESSDYSICLYLNRISIENENLNFSYIYHIEIGDIKGEYASFFVEESKQYFSCFYLNKQNIYNLTLFEFGDNYYEKGETLELGSPSSINDDKICFFKGISLCPGYAVYAYYTGDNNEIPTLLIKKINYFNFKFSNYISSINNITLTEYSFNNDLKSNDLCKASDKEFFFVSTSINKEALIIAYFK